MAFDMGFNFRLTAVYVTDPAYAAPVLFEAYPHTYTNANGDSINAGWPDGNMDASNEDSGNDPRIAGLNGKANSGGVKTFTVDLSSGSNPGAGDYTVDLAMGRAAAACINSFEVWDNTTLLIDGKNGGSGYFTNADEYIDATLATVSATTTWTGTTASKTFATTTALLKVAVEDVTSQTYVAHFRLTLGGAAATTRLQHLAYGISNGIFLGR